MVQSGILVQNAFSSTSSEVPPLNINSQAMDFKQKCLEDQAGTLSQVLLYKNISESWPSRISKLAMCILDVLVFSFSSDEKLHGFFVVHCATIRNDL